MIKRRGKKRTGSVIAPGSGSGSGNGNLSGSPSTVQKWKATVNELSWLDQHEQQKARITQVSKKPKAKSVSFPSPWNRGSLYRTGSRLQLHQCILDDQHEGPTQSEILNSKHHLQLSETSAKESNSYVAPSAQYGNLEFEVPTEQNQMDVFVQLAHPYQNDQYGFVISSHHPALQITVKSKWPHAILVQVNRLQLCESITTSLSWIAVGNLAQEQKCVSISM